MVVYAVVAGLVAVASISLLGAYEGEIGEVLLTASDAARALLHGQG